MESPYLGCPVVFVFVDGPARCLQGLRGIWFGIVAGYTVVTIIAAWGVYRSDWCRLAEQAMERQARKLHSDNPDVPDDEAQSDGDGDGDLELGGPTTSLVGRPPERHQALGVTNQGAANQGAAILVGTSSAIATGAQTTCEGTSSGCTYQHPHRRKRTRHRKRQHHGPYASLPHDLSESDGSISDDNASVAATEAAGAADDGGTMAGASESGDGGWGGGGACHTNAAAVAGRHGPSVAAMPVLTTPRVASLLCHDDALFFRADGGGHAADEMD